MSKLYSQRGEALEGTIRVPGDKSISHRALIMGATAVGETKINGLLEADDVLRTAKALRILGITAEKTGDDWSIQGVGVGGFSAPQDILDFGNSGTGARLLIGLLSTQDLKAIVTGDRSLRSRPMGRVMEPLSNMGAFFESQNNGRMPIVLHGAQEPIPISYELPVPSAQVKSAILLAALNTPGKTIVIENAPTRDHTENMLKLFGAELEVERCPSGKVRIELNGYPELSSKTITIPGDPSSAAFPGIAALIIPGSNVTIENVCINPLRSGYLDTLQEMGADVKITNPLNVGGELMGDLTYRYTELNGVTVPSERAPLMIDEYPIIAIAAAFAAGKTRLCGLAELRVKESNRFLAIVEGLTACGVVVDTDKDDIVIEGCGGPPPGGAEISVNLDHRVAMSYLVMGLAARKPVVINDGAPIETSFPNFRNLMNELGAKIGVPID